MLCCMAGNTRTAKAITLGASIAELRKEAQLSQRKLAAELGRDNATVSRWESGERPPSPQQVSEILRILGVTGERAADLIDMASGTDEPQWLAITLPARRQQLGALLNAERTATRVTHVAPLLIPGVLQSTDVIRSIMVEGGVPTSEIDERVAVRIGRRELITRREPAYLDVLLGELAIRQILGSPKIMADQLRYLLELGELPNVDLRVVPYSAGWHPAMAGSFILIDSDEDEIPSVAHVEMQRSGLIFHDRDDIDAYRHAADMVRKKAMSPADTQGLIAEVLTEMENCNDSTV
jgi:transcriptional regulator with XRE-family HTH domain